MLLTFLSKCDYIQSLLKSTKNIDNKQGRTRGGHGCTCPPPWGDWHAYGGLIYEMILYDVGKKWKTRTKIQQVKPWKFVRLSAQTKITSAKKNIFGHQKRKEKLDIKKQVFILFTAQTILTSVDKYDFWWTGERKNCISKGMVFILFITNHIQIFSK